MKLIQSEKGIKLPTIYFVTNIEDVIKIPIGVPFIRGTERNYKNIVRTLEFEVLLKSALATGLKFKWFDLLEEHGFRNVLKEKLAFSEKTIGSGGELKDLEEVIEESKKTIKEFVEDAPRASYIVDLEVLKNLEVIPTFLNDIEKAIEINIHNGYKFNSTIYNKKLGLPLGDTEISISKKNLIIIDISSSIPRSISSTILALAKTMATQFYADLLITGSKSTLYRYDEVDSLDTNTIYNENGEDNDQVYFRRLLEGEYERYGTAIVFGDNHSPCQSWSNSYNKGTNHIKIEQGQTLCKWEVDEIVSFHVDNNERLAGYAEWFECDNVTHMKNWVRYFD